MTEPVPSPELLLAHGAFVRAAACAVLRGDAEVDDVVQETWLRALDRGPRAPGALTTWLGRVARNLALDTIRLRGRRRRRETAAARPEGVRSVEEIVIREEARSRLVAALLALDEPYRSALVLRYYDGLSVLEVARRLSVPRETAKTRLRRGLERLRERVGARDERSGGLLPLLSWAGELGGSVVGGLAMKKGLVLAGVLLLIGGGYVAYESVRSSAPASPDRPSLVERAAQEPGVAPATPSLAGSEGSAAGARTRASMPFASGVVVDAAGDAIPDVAILSRGKEPAPGRPGQTQDESLEIHRVLATSTARTDRAGRFRVEQAVAEQVSLVFLKAGFVAYELRGLAMDGAKNQDLRIVLVKGRRVVLLVKDTDGRPIERARIGFWLEPADTSDRVLFGGGHTTDRDGRCELAWLPAVERPLRSLFVSAFSYEEKNFFDRPALRETEEFVLRRTSPLFVLRDATSGAPVEGAGGLLLEGPEERVVSVLVSDPMRNPLFVAPPGQLLATPPPSLILQRSSGSFVARVFAEGYLTAEARFEMKEEDEPPRVEIGLARGGAEVALAGRVTPADVEAIEIGRLTVQPGWQHDDDRLPALLRVRPAPDGTFVVRGLPAGSYRLTASAPGLAPVGIDAVAPATGLRIDLAPPARLEVRVTRSSGERVGNHAVGATVEGQRRSWSVRTDGDGVARIEGLPPGVVHVMPFWVVSAQEWEGATKRGRMPAHPSVTLAAGESRVVDLQIPSRLPVTLVVRDESGRATEGIDLTLSMREGWGTRAEGEWQRILDWRGRTDAAGSVRVDLFEGTYDLQLVAGAVKRSSQIQVAPGATTVQVPWSSARAVIAGRVLEAGTRAPIANRVVLVALDDPKVRDRYGEVLTDAEGRFEVGGLPSKPLRVLFALQAGPRRQADPQSPYPGVIWLVTPRDGERTERELVVPRVRGEGAEEPSVEVTVRIVEEGTRSPLAGVSVSLHAVRGDLSLMVGSLKTGTDGRASGRFLHGDRFMIYASRWVEAQTHEPKQMEVTSTGGRIDVDITLAPSAGAAAR